jgi:hypothetical protein
MEDTTKLLALYYSEISREVIEVLLEDQSEPAIFDEIAKANVERPEILRLLYEHPGTPEEVRTYVAGFLSLPAVSHREAVKAKEMKAESLTQKIQKLNVSARVHLALKGGREIRGILARDSNKEVVLSVLDNGRVTETEIEMIAKSRQTFEDALRKISKNKEWMKKYSIVIALVTNPKTPAGISVTHVIELKTRDLVILEKNRNIAEAVRSAARKLLHARKPF